MRIAGAIALLLAGLSPAAAQGVTRVCVESIGANGSNNCVGVGPTYPLPVAPAPLPAFATAETASASGTTGAVTATLAAVAGKTTWLCSLDVSAIGGTAAVGPVTVSGLIGGSFTYQLASSAAGVTLSRTFSPCIAASAADTAISAATTADGSASAVSINLSGFVQ
jgi:hypothetical protein